MVLRHRRLFLLSLVALLSVFVAEALSHATKAFFFWSLAVLSLLFLLISIGKHRVFFLFLASLLTASAFFSSYQVSLREERASRLEEEGTSLCSATVLNVTGNEADRYFAEGRLTVSTEEEQLTLRVKITSPIPVHTGDVLFGEAVFTASERSSYAATHGFYGSVRFEEASKVDRRTGVIYTLGELRTSLSSQLKGALPNGEGVLLSALLLGNREGLSEAFERDMTRIGTTHMLSVSGMHLIVLTTGIAFVLKRLRLERHLRMLFLGAFVVLFMFLTGLSVSVMRAGFMFLIAAFPLFLKEERDGLSSLAAAVAVIALCEPYAVRDVSLWLSAFSTLGILLFFERLGRRNEHSDTIVKKLCYALFLSLSVTASATLATLPLTLCTFGTLPLLSPISNLILTPLVQAALYLSVFVVFLGSFSPLVWITSEICNLIFTISGILADIPHTVLPLGGSSARVAVFVLFGVLLLYFLFCPKKRFLFRVPIALCLACAVTVGVTEAATALPHRNELAVSYFCEEGCDAILFRYKGERLLTVFSDLDTVGAAECAALDATAGELDGFLLPEYTESTIAYTEGLLSSYTVHRLYLPIPKTTYEQALYKELVMLAAEAGVPTVAVDTDAPFFFGSLTVSAIFRGDGYAHAEFLFGYAHIAYYGGKSFGAVHRDSALRAELIVFGDYGGTPNMTFPREELLRDSTRILCADPTYLPLDNAEGIVFSPALTAYIPMRTTEK